MKKIFFLVAVIAVKLNAISNTVVFTNNAVNKIIGNANLPKVIFQDTSNANYDIFQLSVALQTGYTCAEHTFKNAVAGIGLFDTYDQLKNCNGCTTQAKLVSQFKNYANLLTTNTLERHFLNERTSLRNMFASSCLNGQQISTLTASTYDPELVAIADNITAIVASFSNWGTNGIPFISPDMVSLQSPHSINKAYINSFSSLNPTAPTINGITNTNLLTTVLGFREAQKNNKPFRRAMLFELNDDNTICKTSSHIMALIIDIPAGKTPRFIILESHDNTNIANNCILKQFISLLFDEKYGSSADIANMLGITASLSQFLSTLPAQFLNALARLININSQQNNTLQQYYSWANQNQEPNFALSGSQAIQYFAPTTSNSISSDISNAMSNLQNDYMSAMGCQALQSGSGAAMVAQLPILKQKVAKATSKNGLITLDPNTPMPRKKKV